MEREDFKKVQPIRDDTDARRFAVIHEHRQEFEIAVMCRMLDVSRQGYYDWVDRPSGGSGGVRC